LDDDTLALALPPEKVSSVTLEGKPVGTVVTTGVGVDVAIGVTVTTGVTVLSLPQPAMRASIDREIKKIQSNFFEYIYIPPFLKTDNKVLFFKLSSSPLN